MLVSREAADPVELELSYSRIFTAPSRRENAVFHRASTIGTLENRWLQSYLNEAALAFANHGVKKKFVSVVVLNPATLNRNANQQWFFRENRKVEWCINTLAWRDGEDIFAFLPEDADVRACRQWVLLTAESYKKWFSLLNQRVGLDKLFGSPGKESEDNR